MNETVHIDPSDPLSVSFGVKVKFNSIEERDRALEYRTPMQFPLFSPRNEEEILRGMLQLSHEVSCSTDVPHLLVLFDRQKEHELFFHVIFLRVMKKDAVPAHELFKGLPLTLEMIKPMGLLRKRYVKEAALFLAKIEKGPYLRYDLSIDLLRARQALVKMVRKSVGPIRDFNGGMISRELQLLESIQSHCPNLLIDELFFAIDPPIMKTQIDPKLASILFSAIGNEPKILRFQEIEEGIVACGPTKSVDQKCLKERLVPLTKTSHELAITHSSNGQFFGAAFTPKDQLLRHKFKETLTGICLRKN